MYTQRTCVLLRFLRGVSTLGQHLGCLFVGLYIHSSLENQTNIYIRGYFQTSTVSEWIYYFLRLSVHTQKMAQFLFWKIKNTSTLFQSTWNLSSLIYLVCGVFRQFWDSTTIIRFHMKWKMFLHQCCTIQWRKRWHHPPSSGG